MPIKFPVSSCYMSNLKFPVAVWFSDLRSMLGGALMIGLRILAMHEAKSVNTQSTSIKNMRQIFLTMGHRM